jgi:hypothetical protein
MGEGIRASEGWRVCIQAVARLEILEALLERLDLLHQRVDVHAMALSVAANDFEHRRSQDAVAVSANRRRHDSLPAWLARCVRTCVCGCLKGLKAC